MDCPNCAAMQRNAEAMWKHYDAKVQQLTVLHETLARERDKLNRIITIAQEGRE